MARMAHLTDSQLLARALDAGRRLPGTTVAHVGQCGRCRNELERWVDLGRALRDRSEEPPADVLSRAWSLLTPRPPRPVERERFALASLAFDSHAAAPVPAVRTPVPTREQVWRTRGAVVSVQVTGAGLGAEQKMLGRVMPRRGPAPPESGWVWLLQRGQPPRWAGLDPDGEFSLPAPSASRWTLLVEWHRLSLRVEGSA